jgi:DNA-binding CsgD family transcriptional regulator
LLEPDERRALHRRVAEAAQDPGTAADHYAAAGDRNAAYRTALEAAATAESRARRAHFLAVAAENATGGESARLRLRAANALLAVGQYDEALRHATNLKSGNPVLQAEAALRAATACVWLRDSRAAESHLVRGISLVAGTKLPVEARLHIERARLRLDEHDPERAGSVVEGARALANAAGVEQAAARFLYGLAKRLRFLPDAVDDLRAASEMARDSGDDWLEADAMAHLSLALCLFGDPDQARTCAERLLHRANAIEQPGWAGVAQFLLAHLDAHCDGRYAAAAASLRALVDGPLIGPFLEDAQALYALVLAYDGAETDSRLRITRSLARSSLAWARPVLLLARAEVEWLTGRTSAALAAVEELRVGTGRGYEDLLALASIYEAWALVDQGHAPPPVSVPPVASLTAVPLELRALRLLSTADGRHEASQMFEAAADAWARHRHSAELRCRWAAADAARLSGDAARAGALLKSLESRAEQMTPLLTRVRASLRNLGIPSATGTVIVRRARSDSGLTAREREILRYVGSGLSSRDIAHLLSIAPSTVETQIRSAMRKLGAATRIQAATLVWFRTEDALVGNGEFGGSDSAR